VTEAHRAHLWLCMVFKEHRMGARSDEDLESALEGMAKHCGLSNMFTHKSIPLTTRAEQAVRHNPLPYNVDEEKIDVDMHEFYTTKKRS